MKRNKITIDYDEKADVLYMAFGEPVEAITEEIGNVGIRIDEKTNEIVGITVIEFLNSFNNKLESKNIIKIKYDKKLDIAYINGKPIKEQIKKTIALNDETILSFNNLDILIGIEILNASRHLNKKILLQELV